MLVNGIGSSVVFCCSSVAGLILLSTAAPWKYRLPQGLWSQLTKVRVQIPFCVLMFEIISERSISRLITVTQQNWDYV